MSGIYFAHAIIQYIYSFRLVKSKVNHNETTGNNRKQQAIEYILSTDYVKNQQAKARRTKKLNAVKDFLRRTGLFDIAKKLVNKSNLQQSIQKYAAEDWGQDAANEIYFYQSLPVLGIKGARPSDIRTEVYRLYEFLDKSKNVLDIGCNVGFLDMTIAEHVNSVTGLEYNPVFVDIANNTAKILGIDNVSFVQGDFKLWCKENTRTYDAVFSFAVHYWIGLPPEEYAAILSKLLVPGGYLVFESHCLTIDIGQNTDEFEKAITLHNFTKCFSGINNDHEGITRSWTVFRKENDTPAF